MKFIDLSQAGVFPEPRPLTPEERAGLLALYKSQFTAADLQEYTEEDEGIELDEVIRRLEELQKQSSQRPQ